MSDDIDIIKVRTNFLDLEQIHKQNRDEVENAEYVTVFSAKPLEQIELESRARASAEQFIVLLSFMERHGDLSKLPQPQSRIRDRMWLKLTHTLNSTHGGVCKTMNKWKKVWADWKAKTKKKAQDFQRSPQSTNAKLKLTSLEKRLLVLMGLMTVERRIRIVKVKKRRHEKDPLLKQNVEEVNGDDFNLPIAHNFTRLMQPSPTTTDPLSLISKQKPTPLEFRQKQQENHRRPKKMSLNPFNQVTRLYAAVEKRRLRIEEMRERNEAKRIEVERERNKIFSQLANIAQAWIDHQISRDNTSR
ncbi:hypothetical protein ACJJTC_000289 [Scirpophaga incertulas]